MDNKTRQKRRKKTENAEEMDVSAYDMREKNRFFSSFSELFVLFNGLILTAVVFFTFNVYIQKTLNEERETLLSESYGTIDEKLNDLSDSVRTAAAIVKVSNSSASIENAIKFAMPNITDFDHVFWVKKSVSADGSLSSWSIKDIYIDKAYAEAPSFIETLNAKTLREYLITNNGAVPNQSIIKVDIPGIEYKVENIDPIVRSRPFVIAYPISTKSLEKSDFIVGVSDVGHVLPENWFETKQAVHKILVRDISTGRSLYYRDTEFDAEDRFFIDDSANHEILSVGNNKWKVLVGIQDDTRMMILRRSPYIVLIFGIILTLLGYLFVRNNTRQTVRLQIMNKALAQKSFDLVTHSSERDRLGDALKKLDMEYKAIIDAVNDIVFEVRVDGRIVFLNDTWSEITGLSHEECLNKNLFSYFHPADEKKQIEVFNEMVDGDRHAYQSFIRARTESGAYRAMEMAIKMIRKDEDKNLRVVGTLTDVEERRRAEKALSEAEKKYQTIVENAAGGIYQLTSDGIYLSVNPSMARILGYETPDKLIEETQDANESLYVSKEQRNVFLKELEAHGRVIGFEIKMQKKDGTSIWVNESARAVKDDDGSIMYIEGSIEDITQRKDVELKLREAKIKSDLASRAKSEFLANMSHELRTPLNSIIGFSQILKDEALGPIDNRQYWEYSRDIHDSGARLLKVINEILDVSRIEAGERQLNESVIDLQALANSCADLLKGKIEDQELTISNLMTEETPNVIAEELAIKQVLLNLLSNAIKYTHEGGRITVTSDHDDNGLRLSITDTGVGLDEEEIRKALSPFGQVETSLSRAGSGVGLGLTLVDSLMKLHDGRLEIFSEKGIGTTATVIFPTKRVTKSKADDQGKAKQDDGSKKAKDGGNDTPDPTVPASPSRH